MKLTTILLPVLFILMTSDLSAQAYLEMIESGNYSFQEIRQEAESYFEGRDKGRGSGYKQWKRWEYDARFKQDLDGYLQSDREAFHNWAKNNQMLNDYLLKNSLTCESDWKPLGPISVETTSGYNPGIGRVTSFDIDPNNPNHIILGAQTGGIWQSLDGGDHWSALTDDYVNLSVFSLAIDPKDSSIYYWGGEQGFFLRSTDQGNTWNDISPENGLGKVARIIINPRNTQEIWIATTRKGVFHTEDLGESWNQLISEGIYDLEFNPQDTSMIYASGRNIWVSEDAGNSFELVQALDSIQGVKMMAVTEHAPDRIYVLQEDRGKFGGLFISEDRGLTFEKIDHDTLNFMGYSFDASDKRGQAPRDMDIIVSPTDSNVIFIAGINLWRSMDGGENFEIASHWVYSSNPDNRIVGYTHADIDMLKYHNEKVYVASDGGFYLMPDPIDSIHPESFQYLGNGVNIHQFYRIGTAQSDTMIVSGGAQDNGSNILRNGQWYHWFGADGMETFITPGDYPVLYGTYQLGGLLQSYDLGESVNYISGLGDYQGTGRWITPFESDATGENIYVGFDRIYRSSTQGFDFDTISQDLNPQLFKVAPSGNDTIYAVSGTSIFRTNDGGHSEWVETIDLSSFGIRSITGISIHPLNANLIAVSATGEEKVMISRDGGEIWESWSEGVPNFEARCISWQNDQYEALYLGMNYGIYYRDSLTQDWQLYSFGLPNVIINELDFNYERGEIYAASYGRGLWVSPICDKIVPNKEQFVNAFKVYPSPVLSGENLNVEFENIGHFNLRIFDALGYLVYQNKDLNQVHTLSISTADWKSGTYFVRLESSLGYDIHKINIH
jgi:photosystem II stability/assembly factor-like uncharacterized protein